MINVIIEIIKILIAILPFILLCVADNAANLKKVDRSRQFAIPVAAFIYMIAAMVWQDRVNEVLISLIRGFPNIIRIFALLGTGVFSELINTMADGTEMLIDRINLEYWAFFLSNFVIFLIYLIFKRMVISLIERIVSEKGEIHQKVAGIFYTYFDERGIWCLKESYVQARSMLKVLYYTAIILSSVLMTVTGMLYARGLIAAIFCPVFGVIITGELYFYLNGMTKREYIMDILGEDDEAYKTVNYVLLRKFLRRIFGDKLLAENTDAQYAFGADITNDEMIRTLESSEDVDIHNFAGFIKRMNEAGEDIDKNFVASAAAMLKGKSILFNDPFYNDFIPYIFYPINRILLQHKKVLVILGRHSIEADVKRWLEDGIASVTNIPFLWNIGILSSDSDTDNCADIGLITRSGVLDVGLHKVNEVFFKEVGFVVIIEPSKLISTAQIGMNLIIRSCQGDRNENKITYCLCDKNCDGLVDTMSHILMTEITEVSATKQHTGTSSYMCWETDGEYLHHRIVPNIVRYLGMGTELSFAGLKNQVSKTKWYGGESFPVTDMKWIVKQYYGDLMSYAGLPREQKAMDDYFSVSADLWSAAIEDNNYFTVEDEPRNMFEMIRNFATRSRGQGFINIIASDYILKDYMADNYRIFETDAKAIPNIVPDYVRSERNIAMKLILMMSIHEVDAETIKNELSLIGIRCYDLKRQLWFEIYKCYANAKQFNELPEEYHSAVAKAASLKLSLPNTADKAFGIEIILERKKFNEKTGRREPAFSIKSQGFMDACVSELCSARYITEDEKGERHYLGAELKGHIYQKYLPGQLITFDGKYYEIMHLTADNELLLRRAADHINGRVFYRQIREYRLSAVRPSSKIGGHRDVSGLKITREYADIEVKTCGYYRMSRYNDFETAKKVLFQGDEGGIPNRQFFNKEILRIDFPDDSGRLNDKIRYTVTLLLNEIFKTVFADNHHYIAVVTRDIQKSKKDGVAEYDTDIPLTYSLSAESDTDGSGCIYIIEDSQIDLGLTSAVERNLQRLLEIITDYLDWHTEAVKRSLEPPPVPEEPVHIEAIEPRKKKSLFERIKDRLRKLFGRDKTSDDEEFEKEDEVDQAENDGNEEDDRLFKRKPYYESYYLLYGRADDVPAKLSIEETLEYLIRMGLGDNPLKQAREGRNIAETIESSISTAHGDSRCCDFCGAEIVGVEYETLSDGRDRCINCGRTAIKTGEEFRKLFNEVKRNMEGFFGIKINVGIKVEMVNSKKLQRAVGRAFIPTKGFDARAIGVAISDSSGYTLMIENGSPRMSSILTMAHELTHIWQYINWDRNEIKKLYGKDLVQEIYEGMAKWVEVQYAYLINEPVTAKREEYAASKRKDEYGRGFLRLRANYPFSTGTFITRSTPFAHIKQPLDMQYCGEISYD